MANKKRRTKIPQENKVRAELQKEIASICPFCDNTDVGHFEIHHIDEEPSNHRPLNLLLLCPTCHSKITKGDITLPEVLKRKSELLSSLYSKWGNGKQNNCFYSAVLTFEDGSTELTCRPKFKKPITLYIPKIMDDKSAYIRGLGGLAGSEWRNRFATPTLPTLNLSYFNFKLILRNVGTAAIEDYKVFFEFDERIQDIASTNKLNNFPLISAINTQVTYLDPKLNVGKIIPRSNILVGDDMLTSENIFVKPIPQKSKLIIKWKLISKNFKTNGELYVDIDPNIESDYKEVEVEGSEFKRVIGNDMLDYLV